MQFPVMRRRHHFLVAPEGNFGLVPLHACCLLSRALFSALSLLCKHGIHVASAWRLGLRTVLRL